MRRLHDEGLDEINGHLIYAVSDEEYRDTDAWLAKVGLLSAIDEAARAHLADPSSDPGKTLDGVADRFIEVWEAEAGLMTLGKAVAEAMAFQADEGVELEMTPDEWQTFAATASWYTANAKARALGVEPTWDPGLAKTPEGYYQIQGGVAYAVAKSLAAAPFADLLWMETKTADLAEAREFADAIHAVFPDKMLAYNLSPSFSWDTTGMTDDEMRRFPEELGKLGFVFNFITYGGHQIDGLAAEEFTTALREEGMLALARLQRKFRLVESPYRTPQTLVGGPRADAALEAASGRTATTKAMGVGSTQFQHLVQTEVPVKVLVEWLTSWREHYGVDGPLTVLLRPHRAGAELLELSVLGPSDEKLANIIFATIKDRRGRSILSVRDQNTFDDSLRRKRLMALLHLFLIHRYKPESIHYLTPTDDNHRQSKSMERLGIFRSTSDEVGEIIVADIDPEVIKALVTSPSEARERLIAKV
jgi:isocitrate lyase